ncbi:MAG TPA: radical SAM protein [Candidatus Omnitrophota bacterium]|nr:radical SAM protein [Candidatus Omnitrophota bacterium]
MKILVISEPFIKDFCRTQRWPARTRGRALRPPDWLAYATAVLRRDGFDARLIDCTAMNWDKTRLAAFVRRERPEWAVLDSTTPSIFSDIECARICKDAGAKVIMVGTHASALPGDTLAAANGAVDLIALGEYDYTVRDIIRQGRAFESIPGVCFLRDGKPVHTARRPLIADLDSLPFPSWEFIDLRRYFDAGRLYPYINIIGGRGCPYRCIFCQWPQLMFGHAYRFRSAGHVVDEIEYDLRMFPMLKYGEFFFEDDTFTVNKERALSICGQIARRGLKVTWSVNARPDICDLDLFRQMKISGCRQFLVGFESGDQEILDTIKKGVTIEQSRRFVDIAHQAGIEVHGCFVLGLPGETVGTAQKTIDFALSLKLDTIQFSAAVPLPGSEYFEFCRDRGLLKTKSWEDWLDGGEQGAVVDYPGLSIDAINRMVDRGLRAFYLRPEFVVKFLFKNRNIFDVYRKVRGGLNFLSYLIRS